jgi:hypothetical protein
MEPATCLFDALDHSVSVSDAAGAGCDGVEFDDDDDDDDDYSDYSSVGLEETDKLDGAHNNSIDSKRTRRRRRASSSAADRSLSLATILDDASQLFHIAVPCILMQVSLYWIFPVSSSMVGRKLGTYVLQVI